MNMAGPGELMTAYVSKSSATREPASRISRTLIKKILLSAVASSILLLSTVYCLTGPRLSRHHSPFRNCDIIRDTITRGTKTLEQLWISEPGDADSARWKLIGHRVDVTWCIDWCGPRHVVLTRLGHPSSADRHRVIRFGDIEVLELSFGGLLTTASPGGQYALYTWNGWGAYATAILSNGKDSVRLLSLPESERVEGRWLDDYHLHLDVSTTEGLDSVPAKWNGIAIEVQ